jgi:CxxC motif-containing protein (DUF1111 family)
MNQDATGVSKTQSRVSHKYKRAAVSVLVLVSGVIAAGFGMSNDPRTDHQMGGGFALDILSTTTSAPQEAETGFDNAPNGMTDALTHSADQMVFEEVDTVATGLGPVFNAQSCTDCHQSPVTGGLSQVTELRVGQMSRNGQFTNPNVPIGDGTVTITGRSLINDRAICPSGAFATTEVQERTPDNMNIHTLRTSLNTLGDGYVEAIASTTITQIASNQCNQRNSQICGQVIMVPVMEAPGQMRVARFGWKNQHASLLSFAGDAYVNEQGVTNRLFPTDTTTLCKTTTDPEDHPDTAGLADIDHFAQFMRASKAPSRDTTLAATLAAQQGAAIFDQIGCTTCHVSSITTAPAGSVINGGAFVVPDALGNKIIHPYSDFLLHNVGTGDGIVQNGGPQSASKMRTPPLWGVRLRSRLLHDGRALTFEDAIQGHGGEASGVVRNFQNLNNQQQQELITFLKSL